VCYKEKLIFFELDQLNMNVDANNNVDMDPFVPQPVCNFCGFAFCDESCELAESMPSPSIDMDEMEDLKIEFNEDEFLADLFKLPVSQVKCSTPLSPGETPGETPQDPLTIVPEMETFDESFLDDPEVKMDGGDLHRPSRLVPPMERMMLCPVADCDFSSDKLFTMGSHVINHRKKNKMLYCSWKECYHRSFSKDALASHMKLHSEEKSQCSQCDFWGGKLGSLLKHAQKVHGYPRVFKCSFGNCNAVLKSQYGLDRHTSLHSVKSVL